MEEEFSSGCLAAERGGYDCVLVVISFKVSTIPSAMQTFLTTPTYLVFVYFFGWQMPWLGGVAATHGEL